MNTLPNKLWQLLELAIKDAQLCQADKRFRLDMGLWLEPDPKQKVCHVCMAGAVMVQTLESPVEESDCPAFYEDGIGRKLAAVDSLRIGWIEEAYERIHDDSIPDEHADTLDRNMDVVRYAKAKKNAPWDNDWKAHKDLAVLLKEMDI